MTERKPTAEGAKETDRQPAKETKQRKRRSDRCGGACLRAVAPSDRESARARESLAPERSGGCQRRGWGGVRLRSGCCAGWDSKGQSPATRRLPENLRFSRLGRRSWSLPLTDRPFISERLGLRSWSGCRRTVGMPVRKPLSTGQLFLQGALSLACVPRIRLPQRNVELRNQFQLSMGVASRRRGCWWSRSVSLLGAEYTLGTSVRVLLGADRADDDRRAFSLVFLPELPRLVSSPRAGPECEVGRFTAWLFRSVRGYYPMNVG